MGGVTKITDTTWRENLCCGCHANTRCVNGHNKLGTEDNHLAKKLVTESTSIIIGESRLFQTLG